MNSQTKPMMTTGMGLATAAAMIASAVALPISHSMAGAPIPALSSAFTLVDHEHGWSNGNSNWGNWGDNSSNNGSSSNSGSSSDVTSNDSEGSDHEGDHHHGFGNIFGMIGNFLANNQAEVEAFAAGVPTFYLGPVQLGQGVLASAFYNGYNGSGTGLSGVWAYVSSQIGDITTFIKNTVLTVTSLIPAIPLGPVWVGGSRLANAFFDGYNGSATGLAGIISYVTASLGLQAPPAAAARTAAAKSAPASAAASLPSVAAATVTLATPATAAAAAAKRNGAKAAAASAPRAASAAKAAGASAPKAAAASRRAK